MPFEDKEGCPNIKGLNPYKACIYGICRDFLDGIGYDLGTKYLFTFRYSSFIA